MCVVVLHVCNVFEIGCALHVGCEFATCLGIVGVCWLRCDVATGADVFDVLRACVVELQRAWNWLRVFARCMFATVAPLLMCCE